MLEARRSKFWAALLIVHGIICLGGAFFPFYPPIAIFYALVRIPFEIKLIMMLLVGATQVSLGVYLLVETRPWKPKWYWFILMTMIIAGSLLVFPIVNPPGLF
jgi:hypothetical protein